MNSQYFDKEQIKNGEMQKLLDYLMLESYGKGRYYNDIHIKPADCEAFIVEWVQVPWSGEFGGHFELIEEDQVVMLEKQLPDGTFQQFYDEDDYNEGLAEWLTDNPEWKKNEYGIWYSTKDQEAWKKQIESEKNVINGVSNESSEVSTEEVVLTGLSENGIPQ